MSRSVGSSSGKSSGSSGSGGTGSSWATSGVGGAGGSGGSGGSGGTGSTIPVQGTTGITSANPVIPKIDKGERRRGTLAKMQKKDQQPEPHFGIKEGSRLDNFTDDTPPQDKKKIKKERDPLYRGTARPDFAG